VSNHYHVAPVACFTGDCFLGGIDVVFEGRGWVSSRRGEGNGDAFQLVLLLQELGDLIVTRRLMPRTWNEDERWCVRHRNTGRRLMPSEVVLIIH
jgi:hypothetical protein